MKLLIFLILFYFVCANDVKNDEINEKTDPKLDEDAKLKLLFFVHRHGERGLAIKYPNDPYLALNESGFLNESLYASYWPDGDGQLTIPGKLRMYNLGLYLKERYKDFITSNVREALIRSSGLERCIESVQMIAFALYPPKGRWLWMQNITYQPLAIASSVPNTDPMINPHSACKNAWAERAKIYESDHVQRIEKNNKELYDYLSKFVGLNITNIEDSKAVFDALMVERSMHYKLPNWTNPMILSKLEQLYDQTFYLEFMTRKAQMFRTGVFFNELEEQILNRLQFKELKANKILKFQWDTVWTDNKKVFIYSSHDSFISAVLIALGNFDYKAPPFGSGILFEVYQNNLDKLIDEKMNLAKKNKIALDNTFIKFYYLKHTETKNPMQLRLANCKNSFYCSFSEFARNVEDIVITKETFYKKCDE